MYSSVPNRRAGRNKHAGGKILKQHFSSDDIKEYFDYFFAHGNIKI